MTALDAIAPYPDTEANATADAMIRHLLVHAQATWHRALSAGCDPEEADLFPAAYLYGLASLLDTLRHYGPPHVADETARELWAAWEHPPGIGEAIWDDLEALGIDPAQVNQAAGQQATGVAR